MKAKERKEIQQMLVALSGRSRKAARLLEKLNQTQTLSKREVKIARGLSSPQTSPNAPR
jgi:hypothetical protein